MEEREIQPTEPIFIQQTMILVDEYTSRMENAVAERDTHSVLISHNINGSWFFSFVFYSFYYLLCAKLDLLNVKPFFAYSVRPLLCSSIHSQLGCSVSMAYIGLSQTNFIECGARERHTHARTTSKWEMIFRDSYECDDENRVWFDWIKRVQFLMLSAVEYVEINSPALATLFGWHTFPCSILTW